MHGAFFLHSYGEQEQEQLWEFNGRKTDDKISDQTTALGVQTLRFWDFTSEGHIGGHIGGYLVFWRRGGHKAHRHQYHSFGTRIRFFPLLSLSWVAASWAEQRYNIDPTMAGPPASEGRAE